MAKHSHFCCLNGYSGFFQIPIHPDDQEKTTLTCLYGTYAYRRMSFRLCTLPQHFKYRMLIRLHSCSCTYSLLALRGSSPICIGALITSITRALNLNDELATLEPLNTPFLDLDACRSMRLIKNRQDGRYHLMVGNRAVNSIILPNSACTNVQDRNNWSYNLNALEPGHNIKIQGNEGNSTNDDIDEMEHDAPEPPIDPHTTHDITKKFTCTFSRYQSHDDVLSEM